MHLNDNVMFFWFFFNLQTRSHLPILIHYVQIGKCAKFHENPLKTQQNMGTQTCQVLAKFYQEMIAGGGGKRRCPLAYLSAPYFSYFTPLQSS